MARDKKYIALWNVMKREGRRLVSRPLYLFCMVIAPLFCYVFFTTLMDSGLPVNMPVGVVDQDMTSTSRQLMRNLDAFEQTAIVAHYPTINEARAAMQKGEIYGFYYIPKGPPPRRNLNDSLPYHSIPTIRCLSPVLCSTKI